MTQTVTELRPAPAPSARPVTLRARGLHKEFRNAREHGTVEVLRDFDLDVHDGEFVSLLGPSGCGKSTFLNIVAGLEDHDGGTLELDGAPVRGVSRRVGVVFQAYALFPWLDVRRNVEAGLAIRGVPRAERRAISERVLRTVGLADFANQLPHRLSGGMRQRVAIARSLAYDPEVLVLDEPFAALDAQTREHLQEELLRVWEAGERRKTILFVTHSIDEAIYLSDRVAVMSHRPGHVTQVIDVDLPRPRTDETRATPEFGRIRAEVARVLKQEVRRGDDD